MQTIKSSQIFLRLYQFIRWTMGLIFIAAGISKLINLDLFMMILEVYILDSGFSFPLQWLSATSVILAVLEIITGLGLILDLRGFLSLMSAQMLSFIIILIYGIATGLDVDCGCFVLDDPDNPIHSGLRPALYRDLAMTAAICYLYWWRYKFITKPPKPQHQMP